MCPQNNFLFKAPLKKEKKKKKQKNNKMLT